MCQKLPFKFHGAIPETMVHSSSLSVSLGMSSDALDRSRPCSYLPRMLGSNERADPDPWSAGCTVPNFRHHTEQDEPKYLHDLRTCFPSSQEASARLRYGHHPVRRHPRVYPSLRTDGPDRVE